MVLIPRKRFAVVAIAQLVEPWIVIPVVVGSNPISHPIIRSCDNAKVAELVDALASGVSVLTDVGVQVPPLAPKSTKILLALGEGGGIGRRASFRC